MPKSQEKISRKAAILQALVQELENNPGKRITTASLAKAVGVSEAALYRHFPSKAKMFEAIIDFCEESVFGLINKILEKEAQPLKQLEHIGLVILGFAKTNPGISRILSANALVGEHERLGKRIDQFFQRIEAQVKQILRSAELNKQIQYQANAALYADMYLAILEGQIAEYVRSNFERAPDSNWQEIWQSLQPVFLGKA